MTPVKQVRTFNPWPSSLSFQCALGNMPYFQTVLLRGNSGMVVLTYTTTWHDESRHNSKIHSSWTQMSFPQTCGLVPVGPPVILWHVRCAHCHYIKSVRVLSCRTEMHNHTWLQTSLLATDATNDNLCIFLCSSGRYAHSGKCVHMFEICAATN